MTKNEKSTQKCYQKNQCKEQFKSLNCKIKRITDKEREKIKQRQFHKYN